MSKARKTQPTRIPEHKQWPGQATQDERRAARKDIVLADIGVSASTLQRYYFAVQRLSPVLDQVNDEFELDDMISSWIQTEFEDGSPLYLIADALSGLHHLEPFTRKKLIKSWKTYSIWRKYEVPARAPPLTQPIVRAMCGWCLQHDELAMGALLLLGFHCLLRTGELLHIRPCDLLLGDTHGLVTLTTSKSGLRHNVQESVSITDMYALELIRALVEIRTAQHLTTVPCWTRSGTAFRSLFTTIVKHLQLECLGFRPYSLRRGGATLEMQTHGLMERTLVRGRWKNSAVARIYISDGLSMLPSLVLSPSVQRRLGSFSAVLTAEQCCRTGRRGTKRKL